MNALYHRLFLIGLNALLSVDLGWVGIEYLLGCCRCFNMKKQADLELTEEIEGTLREMIRSIDQLSKNSLKTIIIDDA